MAEFVEDAMNSIPSVFNAREISRTVVGGSEICPNIQMDCAVVMINDGWSPSRVKTLDTLLGCGFSSVVSIEVSRENYNIEDFSRRFPSVKFIVPLESVTVGDLVNIAMSEVQSEYVLILRDTLEVKSDLMTPILFSNLTAGKPFCVCPRLTLQGNVSFPVVSRPSSRKSVFDVESSPKVSDGAENLFPYDSIGLFNRKKFMMLGGYDYTIESEYWQNLDLSLRAWLWGEKIVMSTSFAIAYAVESKQLDSTASQYSNRFYLKNLVPRFVHGEGVVPLSSFLLYLPRSGCGFFEAWRQFKDARRWVRENKFRFRLDAVTLVQKWGAVGFLDGK